MKQFWKGFLGAFLFTIFCFVGYTVSAFSIMVPFIYDLVYFWPSDGFFCYVVVNCCIKFLFAASIFYVFLLLGARITRKICKPIVKKIITIICIAIISIINLDYILPICSVSDQGTVYEIIGLIESVIYSITISIFMFVPSFNTFKERKKIYKIFTFLFMSIILLIMGMGQFFENYIFGIIAIVISCLFVYKMFPKRQKEEKQIEEKNSKLKMLSIINTIIFAILIIVALIFFEVLKTLFTNSLFGGLIVFFIMSYYIIISLQAINYLLRKIKFLLAIPIIILVALFVTLCVIMIPQMDGVGNAILNSLLILAFTVFVFDIMYFAWLPYYPETSDMFYDEPHNNYISLGILLVYVSLLLIGAIHNNGLMVIIGLIIGGIYAGMVFLRIFGVDIYPLEYLAAIGSSSSPSTPTNTSNMQKVEKTQKEEDNLYYFTKYEYKITPSYIESLGKYEYMVDVTYYYKNAKGYTKREYERFFGSDYNGSFPSTVRSRIETGSNKHFEPRK